MTRRLRYAVVGVGAAVYAVHRPALLGDLVSAPRARVLAAGAEVSVQAIAALRCTEDTLAERDGPTRDALARLTVRIDTDAVTALWEEALRAPVRAAPPLWAHGDLSPGNVLVQDGRLTAVIDFGCVGIGDPAADVIAAWSVLRQRGREVFRQALDVDDGTWERARGYALHQAALIVPYYATSNPGLVAHALRTVDEVLSDAAGAGSPG